jgi:hypothetical protein
MVTPVMMSPAPCANRLRLDEMHGKLTLTVDAQHSCPVCLPEVHIFQALASQLVVRHDNLTVTTARDYGQHNAAAGTI